MKSIRFLLASCILVAVNIALVMPADAGNTYTGADFAWPDSPGVGYLGLYIDDDISHTRLMSTVRTQSGQLCTSLNDAACANQSVRTYSILPRCETDLQKDCVESLGATTSQGVASEGVFSRYFPERGLGDFEGNPGMNIPTGGAPSIFTLPGVSHSDGNEYMVIASVNGITPTGGAQAPSSITIHASVYPVKVLAGNFMRNTPLENGFGVSHRSSDKWGNCASIADGYCAARQDFPANTKFSLSLRLSTPPKGWLHGRIFSPTVTYEAAGASTRLKVDATPVQVAAVATWGKYSELPEGAKRGSMNCSDTSNCGQMNPQSSGAQTSVEAWRTVYGDKASWVRGQWMYQTLAEYEVADGTLSSCISGAPRFFGFVTTNATGYAAGPPVFDPIGKTLSYVVAAPHADVAGGLIVGTYDLMMRSDLAACLYGGDVSDIVGSVSVVYDNATSTTTEIKTDVTNDGTWLKVSASGFHYSMPTIKTTLKSKSGAEPIVQAISKVIHKSISASALAVRAQLLVSRGDVLFLKVSKSWAKNCIVVRQTLRIVKTGTCRVTVRVESRNSKPRFRTMTLDVKK
ncbi:MAG: hypothetical protein WCG49_01600 [Actinomycetes bacterium]